MANIRDSLKAKSDQLNATDIAGYEPVLHITKINYDPSRQQQPMWIYFQGDNNRPWKPSKGMLRVLATAWGDEADAWIGRKVKVFCEPTVMYAGQEVGGIQIRALSDIPAQGLKCVLTISRTKRVPFPVSLLVIENKPYPEAAFDKAFVAMEAKMKDGTMTLQQVIARCQQTGTLTPGQLERLEKAAPVVVEQNDDEDM